jgi:predicted nuclease with TOPRIM domain
MGSIEDDEGAKQMNGNGGTEWNIRQEILDIPIHEKGDVRPTKQTVYRDTSTGQWTTAPQVPQVIEHNTTEQHMSTELVTSGDATMVSKFFNDIANRIIQASELAKELDQLRAEFETLKQEVETYREHNARLDEEVTRLRDERSQLTETVQNFARENNLIAAELNSVRSALDVTRRESDTWQSQYNTVWNDLATLKRDRDEVHYHNLELEDRLRQMETERDTFRASSEANAALLSEIRNKLSGTTIVASVAA